MDEPYTKREQDHFFGDLFKRIDKIDITLERIEGQTTKTNGRATALETWSNDTTKIIEALLTVSDDYKKSKVRMYTAIAVLVFFIGAMTTLIVFTAKLFIHQEVTTAFSSIEKSYNIQVDNTN